MGCGGGALATSLEAAPAILVGAAIHEVVTLVKTGTDLGEAQKDVDEKCK